MPIYCFVIDIYVKWMKKEKKDIVWFKINTETEFVLLINSYLPTY